MSWSLQVRNGDFTVGSASLGTATDNQKLVQDLSHWILEPMGTDMTHPTYGSLMDGGIDEYGKTQEGFTGGDPQMVTTEVRAEINRIVRDYQSIQLNRARTDKYKLNNATLSRGEILFNVTNIEFNQHQDTLRVIIHIQNGNADQLSLVIPVGAA